MQDNDKPIITCTKLFADIPFGHRQPNHAGHCRFIHGHNWSIEVTFAAKERDACGFVVDFGGLGYLKQYIEKHFDHALVLNETDPLIGPLGNWNEGTPLSFLKLTTVTDCSCEGLAEWFLDNFTALVSQETDGRAWVQSIKLYEDQKNSATAWRPWKR